MQNQNNNDWHFIELGEDPGIQCPKKCPSSATLIVSITSYLDRIMDSSIVYYSYFLSTNKSRKHWILWCKVDDSENPPEEYITAVGPRKGVNKFDVAEKLLAITWNGIIDTYGTDAIPAASLKLNEIGLLEEEVIKKIAAGAWFNKDRN